MFTWLFVPIVLLRSPRYFYPLPAYGSSPPGPLWWSPITAPSRSEKTRKKCYKTVNFNFRSLFILSSFEPQNKCKKFTLAFLEFSRMKSDRFFCFLKIFKRYSEFWLEVNSVISSRIRFLCFIHWVGVIQCLNKNVVVETLVETRRDGGI